MKETSPPRPEEEAALARKALADGKRKRAAHHIGSALAADPGRREWLAILDRIIADAPDPLQLVPADKDADFEDVAVRAYILAGKGQVLRATELLLEMITSHPEQVAYLSWAVAWLDRREATGALDMTQVNAFLGFWLQQFPGLVAEDDTARATLKRLLPFVQKVERTQVVDEVFLFAHAALVRKMGRLDDALAVAQKAHSRQPGFRTAIALAMAHEARGEMDQWYAIYQEALRHSPDDVPARLDLGDKLWKLGRLDESERWYKEALQRDPQHPRARPSYFALRYEMNHDEGWRAKLLEYARAHPGNECARHMALRVAPYVGALPAPADATIHAVRDIARHLARNPPGGPGRSISIKVPWLEAPSARVAAELQLCAKGLDLAIDFTVAKLQTPDPRKPRCPVDYLLWKYKGNDPVPAVREPSEQVSRAVAELAALPYELKEWSLKAAGLGKQLGPSRLEDLLGVMVHPPMPPEGVPAWTWLQKVQVATALALAHIDAGWMGSARRKALFALANGPLDWTVGAAIIALTAIALDNAEPRDDITSLFVQLMKALPKQGYVPYAHVLVCCFLEFPNLSEEERSTLRQWRRDLECD